MPRSGCDRGRRTGELFDLRVFAVRETDVDKADGFAGVGAFTSARAGEAGDAEAVRAASDLANTFRESACDLGAYGALLLDELRWDFGEIGLLLAGVNDGAAVEAA